MNAAANPGMATGPAPTIGKTVAVQCAREAMMNATMQSTGLGTVITFRAARVRGEPLNNDLGNDNKRAVFVYDQVEHRA